MHFDCSFLVFGLFCLLLLLLLNVHGYGKYNAYMCGLGGATKRKYAHHFSHQILKGSKGATRDPEPAATSWAILAPLGGHFRVTWGALSAYGWLWGYFGVTLMSLWSHFGVTLGSASISVGDFGSVDGYFAMIAESLWLYEGPFSKNIHFPNRF